MKRYVPLVVALLSVACGNEPTSPSSLPQSPSFPPQAPPGPPLTMRGGVWDTTNLPISGAQVQVVAPTAGTVAVTDGNGEFALPWPYAGSVTVTVRVSKAGFHTRERSVPEPGTPRYPVSLGFELEAIDSPIIVTGMYDMTFTAASECTQLPTVARQRTYRAQVYPNGRGRFSAMVVNIEPIYNTVFHSEVRGEPPQTLHVDVVTDPYENPAIGLVERIEPHIFFEVTGSTELPLGAQSAAAAFDGTFSFCPAEAAVSYETPYRCPVQPTTCRSANHRLAWMRQ